MFKNCISFLYSTVFHFSRVLYTFHGLNKVFKKYSSKRVTRFYLCSVLVQSHGANWTLSPGRLVFDQLEQSAGRESLSVTAISQ